MFSISPFRTTTYRHAVRRGDLLSAIRFSLFSRLSPRYFPLRALPLALPPCLPVSAPLPPPAVTILRLCIAAFRFPLSPWFSAAVLHFPLSTRYFLLWALPPLVSLPPDLRHPSINLYRTTTYLPLALSALAVVLRGDLLSAIRSSLSALLRSRVTLRQPAVTTPGRSAQSPAQIVDAPARHITFPHRQRTHPRRRPTTGHLRSNDNQRNIGLRTADCGCEVLYIRFSISARRYWLPACPAEIASCITLPQRPGPLPETPRTPRQPECPRARCMDMTSRWLGYPHQRPEGPEAWIPENAIRECRAYRNISTGRL